MSSSSDSTSSPQGKFTKVGSKRQNKRQKREDKARAIADLRNRASEKTQTHVEPRYNEPGEGKKGKAKAQFGRRITPESKTLPKVQVEEVHTAPKEPELADLRSNRYFVKSWLTHSPSSRHPGAARWAGNLKAGSERPKMPKAPLNLSHEVWQKLRSIFAGEGCPLFAKEMDMNKANVQRPVYNYCIIALIRAMVEQWASDDGKMVAHDLCFLQSDQYFQVFLCCLCSSRTGDLGNNSPTLVAEVWPVRHQEQEGEGHPGPHKARAQAFEDRGTRCRRVPQTSESLSHRWP